MSFHVIERPVPFTRIQHEEEWVQPVAVREWLRSCPVVSPEMTCEDLVSLFRHKTELECVAVCDENRRPLGLVMKHRFFRLLGSLYGMSLFGHKKIPVLMEREPLTADADAHPRELIDGALSRDEASFYDAVMITERGKFAGILTVSDLLHISRLLQKDSAHRQIRTVRGAETMIRDIHQAVEKLAAESENTREGIERISEMTKSGREDLEGMLRLFFQWADNALRQQRAMDQLIERAAAADQIVKLISNLADQSNLLAVNATIEAARAGEHGRGFGVVAEQMRDLADGTKRSAGQINRLLKTMSEALSETVSLVREGKQGADLGVVQVRRSEMTFARLWETSACNSDAAFRLIGASREPAGISNGISREIGTLIEQMNGSSIMA